MNTLVHKEFHLLHMTLALRDQLMESITDNDLVYRLPGANISLGELCREMGEVQGSYIESFRTFKHDYRYQPAVVGVESSTQRLSEWFKALDAQLESSLSNFSEDDLQTKMVDRVNFTVPVHTQFHIYREALLIFYGKASVYLKALNKPLSTQWQQWIG